MQTPKHYNDHLKTIGGLSHQTLEPRFVLWLGGTPFPRLALPLEFLAPYKDRWTLLDYHPPEEFGLASEWPGEWGTFPSRGGYLPLQMFNCPIDSEGLNKNVLSLWVYVTLRHEHDTMRERMRVYQEVQDDRRERELKELADKLENYYPAFGTA